MAYLFLENVYWKDCSTESILSALSEFSYVDSDFSGENGEEYTREEALKVHKTTLQYVVDKILTEDKNAKERHLSVSEIVSEFLYEMMGRDSYYSKYSFRIMNHPNFGNVGVSISWAVEE